MLVVIQVSKEGETPLTIDIIEKCFTNPNETIDPSSTSHFEAAFTDNKWRRVREGQPNIVIDKNMLINNEKLDQIKNHLTLDNETLSLLDSYSLNIDSLRQIFSSLD